MYIVPIYLEYVYVYVPISSKRRMDMYCIVLYCIVLYMNGGNVGRYTYHGCPRCNLMQGVGYLPSWDECCHSSPPPPLLITLNHGASLTKLRVTIHTEPQGK